MILLPFSPLTKSPHYANIAMRQSASQPAPNADSLSTSNTQMTNNGENMPTVTYDRSHLTNDFEMIDLATAEQIEIQIDRSGKVWINLNGKCLLRVCHVGNIVIENSRNS